MKFETLKGKRIVKIENDNNEVLRFYTEDEKIYQLFHESDCCEEVFIADICGDLDDLLDSEILVAEESTNDKVSDEDISKYAKRKHDHERFLWTFYKLRTMKGDVTLRWFGESNGYYSVSVIFEEVKKQGRDGRIFYSVVQEKMTMTDRTDNIIENLDPMIFILN